MTTAAQVRACADCLDAVDMSMVAACASVGIEHGLSTRSTLLLYLAGFHDRGHVEEPRAEVRA